MTERKRADLLTKGEEFGRLNFVVTEEFNENYLHAVEDLHARYMEESDDGAPIVHPSLLIVFSNHTRSPSFYLPPGMAAVQTHERVEFASAGRVGGSFTVTWKVTETYERRGRPYQVVEAQVVDDAGAMVIRRTTTYTYVGGPYPGAGQ